MHWSMESYVDTHVILINTLTKAVKYWLKLVKLPDNILPKAAYETVKSLDDKGVKTWASDIRTCLFQYGFYHGFHKWETKQVSYES